MTIRQLDPADSVAVGQWYDLAVAVTRYDVPDFPTPSRRDHLATEHALLAWDGGQVIGQPRSPAWRDQHQVPLPGR